MLNKIEVMVNEAFPIKLIKPSKVKISPPWYTGGLAEAYKKKLKLYSKYRKKPSLENEHEYKN